MVLERQGTGHHLLWILVEHVGVLRQCTISPHERTVTYRLLRTFKTLWHGVYLMKDMWRRVSSEMYLLCLVSGSSWDGASEKHPAFPLHSLL